MTGGTVLHVIPLALLASWHLSHQSRKGGERMNRTRGESVTARESRTPRSVVRASPFEGARLINKPERFTTKVAGSAGGSMMTVWVRREAIIRTTTWT